MPVGIFTLTVTTDAAGAGTANSQRSISGDILEFRLPLAGTALTATGGTTDFTITRGLDGGTILALSNTNAPWQFAPREQVYTTSGGSIIYAAGTAVYSEGVPVAGTVTMVVAQGQPAISGTVYGYYRV